MKPELIEEAIQQAIAAGDDARLRECAYAMKSSMLEADHFPEQQFEFLLRLLNQQEFLDLGGAWYFIMLFGSNQELLSDNQNERLLPAMRFAYQAFDEINSELIIEATYQAITSGSAIQLEECASAVRLSLSSFTTDHFLEQYFDFLLNLLNRQEFLKLEEGSWHLLSLFKDNWEYLSEHQKERLFTALEPAYGELKDWMSHFIISELLGEYFANEEAFEILCRLKMLEAEGPRALVPHGLEHIVRDSDNEHLSKKAYVVLLQMRDDPSEQVRDEVEESLQRLSSQGIEYD